MANPQLTQENFLIACSNIPNSDIDHVKSFITIPNEYIKTDDDIKKMLTNVRWTNPICDYCLDKSNPNNLFLCKDCLLTFYCSENCMEKHSKKHSKRCCNINGPLDDGPMKIAILKTQ
jgi:hypothetical protein